MKIKNSLKKQIYKIKLMEIIYKKIKVNLKILRTHKMLSKINIPKKYFFFNLF